MNYDAAKRARKLSKEIKINGEAVEVPWYFGNNEPVFCDVFTSPGDIQVHSLVTLSYFCNWLLTYDTYQYCTRRTALICADQIRLFQL
jgi:hypothetical protein